MLRLLLGTAIVALGTLPSSAQDSDRDALISELRAEIAAVREFRRSLEGAVIAFDRTGGCPDGWTDMGPNWRGRTLVAGVDNSNDEFSFRRSGGARSVKIEIKNMPAHNHGGSTGTDVVDEKAYKLWSDARGGSRYTAPKGSDQLGFEDRAQHTHAISSQGDGVPLDIIPPYIALYFCKKESG